MGLLVIAVSLIVGRPATAQTELARWSVTPLVGGAFGDELAEPTSTAGVAVGLRYARRVVLEGDVSRVSEIAQGTTSGSAWLAGGRLLYLAGPLRARLVPFGSVGGSLVRLGRMGMHRATMEVAGTAGGGGLVPAVSGFGPICDSFM